MSSKRSVAKPAVLSPRPAVKTQQSASLPSTPNQRPRDRSPPSRSPSAKRNASNPSPRPHHQYSLPVSRRLIGGCKYETGMANAKRRVPYSLGPDKLDPDPVVPKTALSPDDDERLTAGMVELYQRLLPSPESEDRRRRLVEKLESILRKRWPDHTITVNVFGSTGNKLGTTDSDVDICITTDCKELEKVCVIADVLANQGMQRVVCISAAKVPIVKIWDAELKLACDMNVNNPVALENTDMIRSYVEVDARVRPLAMIIKHWTKRRVLNQAALGGTLSSYTWICMIINFLQTRNPPILPALQQSPFLETKILCGLDVAFDRDLALFRDYGSKNTDSLGALLFQFFRYYGHEIDFETSVMSVREGNVITKVEKNWQFLQDNRLCVEEPFNTSRNLGNTADDTSVRGIHLELRRGFKMVSEAQLSVCCEEYEPPSNSVDDVRPNERQSISLNRLTLAYPTTTLGRTPRAAGRGGRHNNPPPRISNSARRASSASIRSHASSQLLPLRNNMTQADLSWQAQQRQSLLHDQLFQQYQYLQAQEQELRAQLQQPALLQGRMVPNSPFSPYTVAYAAFPVGLSEELVRSRVGVIPPPPLTAPILPQGFAFSAPYGNRTPVFGSTTNPPSPLLHSVLPDGRRSYRSSSMTDGSSGGSLRAQSQPPRPVPSPLSLPRIIDRRQESLAQMSHSIPREPPSSTGSLQDSAEASSSHQRYSYQGSSIGRGGSEYIGYYLGRSPPLPIYSRSAAGSPLTSNTGLGIQNGSISPHVLARIPTNSAIPPLAPEVAPPPAEKPDREQPGTEGNSTPSEQSRPPGSLLRSGSGPVVVNGSVHRYAEDPHPADQLHNSLTTTNFDASTSDDVAVDTPSSSEDVSQGFPEPSTLDSEVISVEDHHVVLKAAPLENPSKRAPRPANGYILTSGAGLGPNENGASGVVDSQHLTTNGIDTDGSASAVIAVRSLDDENEAPEKASQHSPAKEISTPLPNQSHQSLLINDFTQTPSKPKMKGKSKPKKSLVTPIAPGEDKSGALTTQPNGFMPSSRFINPASTKELATGWQAQKKKPRHKKGSKSETDVKGVNAVGGDFLPLNESMRKGG